MQLRHDSRFTVRPTAARSDMIQWLLATVVGAIETGSDDPSKFLDKVPLALFASGAEGKVIHANPACVRLAREGYQCERWMLASGQPGSKPAGPPGDSPERLAWREPRIGHGLDAICTEPSAEWDSLLAVHALLPNMPTA